MSILDTIVVQKKIEVEAARERLSVKALAGSGYSARTAYSLREKLLAEHSSGIIAEFKRRSPSKGVIYDKADVVEVVKGYADAGVAGCSVLTDPEFFGGCADDLRKAREAVSIPLLRKDFMIDAYQFYEAKNWGADVVLLIAAILSPKQVREFTDIAHDLGLEVLLELHGEEEWKHMYQRVDMVGINNRNLKTFEVDVERSVRMAEELGKDVVKVAESGISDVAMLRLFRQHGFKGFLIGENFMKTANPALACRDFIQSV